MVVQVLVTTTLVVWPLIQPLDISILSGLAAALRRAELGEEAALEAGMDQRSWCCRHSGKVERGGGTGEVRASVPAGVHANSCLGWKIRNRFRTFSRLPLKPQLLSFPYQL